MKGTVLGYDTENEAVVLRAEDGTRYRFALSDWRDRQSPRKGDEIDFEPDGKRAREVYAAAPRQPVDTAAVSPMSVVAGWAPARFFLIRPVLSCAILVLLACFAGAYSIGDMRISLFQVPDLIARMSESLDSLIAASGTDPAPRLGAGVARILLVLLLALYLVPILAALTIWREFVGRPDRKLARYAGLAAIVLPIGLPLLIALVVQVWVIAGIPDVGARLGRSGVTTPQQVFEVLRLFGSGTILLIFAGAALWASATGRLSVPLGVRQAAEPEQEAIKPKARTRPDLFAPLRWRRTDRKPAKAAPDVPLPMEITPDEPPAGDSRGVSAAVPFLKLGGGRKRPGAEPPQPQPAPTSGQATASPSDTRAMPQPDLPDVDRETAAIAEDISVALGTESGKPASGQSGAERPPLPSAPQPPGKPQGAPAHATSQEEAASSQEPPPFLKVRNLPASPEAADDKSVSGEAASSETELPQRGGSVWPQPVRAPLPPADDPEKPVQTRPRKPGVNGDHED